MAIPSKEGLVGLALSGGGIRSATFALGVLQALARADLLKRFDYLSTVSGGGYIGGSLTWLLSQPGQSTDTGKTFPYGVERQRLGRNEAGVLTHLRLHGNYLTPGRGITALSLVGVFLRGLVLNLLVWIPLASVFFWVLHGLATYIGGYGCRDPYWVYFAASGIVGLVFVLVFVAVSAVYSVATRNPGRLKGYVQRCFRRPDFEKHIRWLVGFALALAGLGTLPHVSEWAGSEVLSAASFFAGIVGGLRAFRGWDGEGGRRIPLAVLAPVASMVVLYGLALVSYELAALFWQPKPLSLSWLIAAFLVSVFAGWCVNLNYISIHRYYRDRLMEAFMPWRNTTGAPAPARGPDARELSKMRVEHGPYHLVNTNVVLVDSDDPRWRVRGADAFLLSPLHCGGTAAGWVETAKYMERDPLTFPTAIAISGAAVHPNTGRSGADLTRQPVVSVLMALLNLRLGYWVPRPNREPQPVPNHFRAAWHELSRHGYTEKRSLLQLSDGGHFENLAVYELVRRRVKVIVCCDASADRGFDFASLQLLMRRIGSDFGAHIEFCNGHEIERLIPRDPNPAKVTDAFPVGARFAERGYIRGKIVYPEGPPSILILLKTTMTGGLPLLVRGYKGANPDFPDQTTADQFFDEDQFEAYRELGYEIADALIKDRQLNLRRLLGEYTDRQDADQDPTPA